MRDTEIQRAAAVRPQSRGPVPAPRRLSSHALFGGASTVVIEHAGALYSLRITRAGKLILTK